jgi:uncharacterized oxidoreductase
LKTTGNTVLITGGSSGIGLALTRRFSERGNEVLICGRSEEKLRSAKEMLPKINTMRCDITKKEDLEALVNWTRSNFPDTNLLVNNAGIQKTLDLKKGIDEGLKADDEIETNLKAQIHLSAYFIPLFLGRQSTSAILNMSSGLGFVPLARFPVYSATKAAIHSFSISLRHQLKDTPIKVFEVIPPTVYDTLLKGKPLEKTDWMVSSAEVADAVMKGLDNDEFEIAVGPSKNFVRGSRSELDQAFDNMNRF